MHIFIIYACICLFLNLYIYNIFIYNERGIYYIAKTSVMMWELTLDDWERQCMLLSSGFDASVFRDVWWLSAQHVCWLTPATRVRVPTWSRVFSMMFHYENDNVKEAFHQILSKLRFYQNRFLHLRTYYAELSARTNRTPLPNRVPTSKKCETFVREQCSTFAELFACKCSVQCTFSDLFSSQYGWIRRATCCATCVGLWTFQKKKSESPRVEWVR